MVVVSKEFELYGLLGDQSSYMIETAARKMAGLEEWEEWPSDMELNRIPSTEEYRWTMLDRASEALFAVLPSLLEAAWDKGFTAGQRVKPDGPDSMTVQLNPYQSI